jgi:DNA polymerase/3'-5' exonuclease PolX
MTLAFSPLMRPATSNQQPETKQRFPRALAIDVARELCNALAPHCERLVVAGSLRRRKKMVGDVEILFIPKTKHVPKLAQTDMFSEVGRALRCAPDRGILTTPPPDLNHVDLAVIAIERLVAIATILPRKTSTGSVVWGPKNKLAYHVTSGIPVDLFSATLENWFNYLVCRTGSADNNTRIASAAQAKGWKWNPYGPGFTDQENNIVRVDSEEDVFRLAGLPYLEPQER